MGKNDLTVREKIDFIIVDYHLDAEKALAGKTKHYPSIVEAGSKIIALIEDELKKQIDIKRDYAFGESNCGNETHRLKFLAMVNAYNTVLRLIKEMI